MNEDKRFNEVIRVQKRPSNFVLIDKSFLEDTRLSYKAKGILAYLLSKPDNWKVIVGNLVNYSVDGKSSVYAGLKELKKCGYYEKNPVRDDKGHFIRWESTVYECPNPLTTFQEMEKPDMDYPNIENREHNNNYINNNYKTKNHVQSCQPGQPDEPVEDYLKVLKSNVSYNDLKIAYQDDIKLIDEFITIALDAILSECKTIRIDGQNKPKELVTSNLMKLRYENIVHVLEQFKAYNGKIHKKAAYILSMLYHSPMEINAHYTNRVQADWGIGGNKWTGIT